MKGNKGQKNKRNSELKAIFFIILISAVMFIISTYAWFTTQKNVSITNLSGTVEVAEGLEISLDAKTWSNGIVLGEEEGQLSIIDDAYPGHHNLQPTEMLPVSTLGLVSGNMTDLKLIRGKVTNSIQLSEIVATDEKILDSANAKYPGYFAFDIFLKNSSKQEEYDDVLQLNYDSSLEILEASKASTGLQNTVRVAFAKYGTAESGTSDVMADQVTVLEETAGIGDAADPVYISDVAIWEPNSSDHVEYIVTNNNQIKWAAGDQKYNDTEKPDGGMGFGPTTQMPTFALRDAAIDNEIADIYDWSGTNNATLQKQIVLQTTKTSESDYSIAEGVQNLISTSDTGDGSVTFGIAPNRISRIRVYVWLEGQDVDTINYASHGGGVKLNIGLVKGSEEGTHELVEPEP